MFSIKNKKKAEYSDSSHWCRPFFTDGVSESRVLTANVRKMWVFQQLLVLIRSQIWQGEVLSTLGFVPILWWMYWWSDLKRRQEKGWNDDDSHGKVSKWQIHHGSLKKCRAFIKTTKEKNREQRAWWKLLDMNAEKAKVQ